MVKFISFALLVCFFNCFCSELNAQILKSDNDAALKEQIYTANKKVIMNYSMKDFDRLFFEFNRIKAGDTIISKETFYTYTIKIGTFSDRLAKLYPEEKVVAEQSKQQWFSESYEDYLRSKATQK